jgi:hypothetical protein
MATPRKGRLRMDDAPQAVQNVVRQILDRGERIAYTHRIDADGAVTYRIVSLPARVSIPEEEEAVEVE